MESSEIKHLTLWAESPEEARAFMKYAVSNPKFPIIEKIYVAKRSPNFRTNSYVGGHYYETTNDAAVDVINSVITAPHAIVDLVQWCTCDVMLSVGELPCVVLEDTTHIVRMNLYQRIPRLARAALLGVPSLILQGTRGLDFSLRGDRWALYRYLQAFNGIAICYPNTPTLPFWYEPDPTLENEAHVFVIEHIIALLTKNNEKVMSDRHRILSIIETTLRNGFRGDIARDIPSIEHDGDEVVVKVGVKPDKKSWVEKGSGQMDPYVGMILAAKYIYCFDEFGRKVKPLVVEFTYLKSDFWWFSDLATTTSLYKRLPIEFADKVRWCG